MFRKNLKHTTLVIIILVGILLSPISYVQAQSVEEELKEKQVELEQLTKELEDAENAIERNKNNRSSSETELDSIQTEIEDLENSLKINKLKVKKLESQIEVKEIERDGLEEEQTKQYTAAYIFWKSDSNPLFKIIASGGNSSILKTTIYYQVVAEKNSEKILGLATNLNDLSDSYEEYQSLLKQIEKENIDLDERKKFLENQIVALDEAIIRADENVDGVRAKLDGVKQETDELEARLEEEGDSGSGGSKKLVSGEIYFKGGAISPAPPADVSVDAFGHGLGLSQWGAYGAGNAGWSAEQIVTHYYKDTHVEARSGKTISVQGYGTMSIDQYAAGIGEVPSKACGTLREIENWDDFADSKGWSATDPRRKKYVLDNPSTVWDCWPEEAIKAQVIVARSYGYTSSQPICTSTACQVYIGGNAKEWAAWETSNQFIISDGYTSTNEIIRAYYSAYNNNGWGTADHATVWGANDGSTKSYSYLKAVKDSNFTYNYTFTRTSTKRTNSYSMSDLDAMIDWCSRAGNCSTYAWIRDNVNNVVGKLDSLEIVKDASGRARQVRLIGDTGEATVSGRYFRSVYNLWVEKVRPSGEVDKIPSITFTAETVK